MKWGFTNWKRELVSPINIHRKMQGLSEEEGSEAGHIPLKETTELNKKSHEPIKQPR